VTDLTTSGTAHGFGFTNTVRREIIMMDITFSIFYSQTVKDLCFTQRSECQNVEDLSLAAGKERTAMRTCKQAYFAGNRTYFIQLTSVRTDLINGNSTANDLFHQLLRDVSYVFCIIRIFFNENFCNFSFYLSNVFFTL